MTRKIAMVLSVLALGVSRADAATLSVCASGCTYTDPQVAVDAAKYGDTVFLKAGETFVTHLVLRAKPGSGWIDIRSDTSDSLLPADGVRLVPDDRPASNTPRARLARIIGRGGAYKTAPILRTEAGAHGYRVRFLDLDGTAHIGYETLVQLGDDGTAASPYDIVLDRLYVHGHMTKGQKRGIALNGTRLSVVNSYIADIKAVNADSQGINGYNGAGPLLIENNHIEAAGENILFGGGTPAITGLVPSDITIRRNHLYKPLAWRNDILSAPGSFRAGSPVSGSLAAGTHYFRVTALLTTGTKTAVSAPSTEIAATATSSSAVPLTWTAVAGAERYRIYRGTAAGAENVYLDTPSAATSFTYTGGSENAGTPASIGTKWVVKNILELKNAERVLIEGNRLENVWSSGQYGYALVLTPRISGLATWTRVRDVTITGNIVSAAAGVINVAGYDDSGTTLRTERITLRNNLFYDIDNTKYGGLAKAFLIGDGPASVVIDRNTLIHTNSSIVYPYGSRTIPGFVYTNNISLHNKYGIMGDGSRTGIPTITKYFPAGNVTCNVLAGGAPSDYPSPNAFPPVSEWFGSFENAAGADYRLRPGSSVALAGCSSTTPGADFVVLDAALSGVRATPVDTPTPGTNQPPVAKPGGPYSAAVGVDVFVNGSLSSDPDGSIANYRWTFGDEVLVRAADLPASAVRGNEWVKEATSAAAGGAALRNPNLGAAKRSTAQAAPASYVEFQVAVAAGVPYRLWMRMHAYGNSYSNDSLFVQFSGATNASGAGIAEIGTTGALPIILEEGAGAGVSGWGWNDDGYGTIGLPIYFPTTGVQTIRIQAREDGVAWDQLLLTSNEYYDGAPGLARLDATMLPAALGAGDGSITSHRYARTGIYPVTLKVTDTVGSSATASTIATIGVSQ